MLQILSDFRPSYLFSKIDLRWQSYIDYILQGLLNILMTLGLQKIFELCSPRETFLKIDHWGLWQRSAPRFSQMSTLNKFYPVKCKDKFKFTSEDGP